MIRDFMCPNCKTRGLHFSDKNGRTPERIEDITYLWCLYCGYKIESGKVEEDLE